MEMAKFKVTSVDSVCSDNRLCLLFNDLSFDKMDAMTDEWTNTSPGKNKTLEEPAFLLHSPLLILQTVTCNWTGVVT
jgi:hypothetical protein